MDCNSLLSLFLIILLGLTFWACSEEDDIVNEPVPNTSQTIVNFAVASQTLPESGEPLKVNIAFDRPASTSGSFSIRLSGDAVYAQNFHTSPTATEGVVTLNMEKGQTAAFITVTPLKDESSPDSTAVVFTLENPSAGFKLGNQITSSVGVVKDAGNPGEDPATIGFDPDSISVSESVTTGVEISLRLQGIVAHTEIVTIDILPTEGFVYGTNYRTDPIAVQNSFNLEVNPGMEAIKFRVIPINDKLLSGDFTLQFSIANTSDGIITGTQTSFILKIEEDDSIDPIALHTIADLRNKFENHEGDWYLSTDYYIEGIVTSESNVTDERTIYIQDLTGGIMLVFTAPKLPQKGDKVQLNLKDAEGNMVNGQKALTGVTNRAGIVLGRNFEVEPELITLEQLHSGNYQGKRVRVQQVTFTTADGINNWFGTQRMSDGGRFAFVTTYATADFSEQVLPAGKLTITGIVGDWNRLQPQNYLYDVVR